MSLHHAAGKTYPKAGQTVVVHYTGIVLAILASGAAAFPMCMLECRDRDGETATVQCRERAFDVIMSVYFSYVMCNEVHHK